MGWDDSDTVAIVAFVVSLVALLVAFAQFAQSSAVTAEGSKECGRTSIGKWSVYTTRPWVYAEFRRDVKYQMPEIVVLDCSRIKITMEPKKLRSPVEPKEVRSTGDLEAQKKIRHNFSIMAEEHDIQAAEGDKEAVKNDKVIGPIDEAAENLTKTAADDRKAVPLHVLGLTNSLDSEIEKSWDLIHQVRDETTQAKSTIRQLLNDLAEGSSKDKFVKSYRVARDLFVRYETLVSWDNFLSKLYQQQLEAIQYTSGEDWDSKVQQIYDKSKPESKSGERSSRKTPKISEISNAQTLVAFKLEEQSWSAIPPEVARPPARSTLGDVILLAQYLGMSWQECDPGSQSYRAFGRHGQGLHMSSSQVSGLGIVFQFDAVTSLEKLPLVQMLRTENANKMFFGIVPRVAELGVCEIRAVNYNGEIDWRSLFLEELQLPLSTVDKLLNATLRKVPDPGICAVKNDLLPLLAPFMPLDDCPCVRINNPIPLMSSLEDSKRSVFADWRCCEKLGEALLHIDEFRESEFQGVRKSFEDLKNIYERRAITLFVDNNIPRSTDSPKEVCRAVADLRKIHEETTTFLKDLVPGDNGEASQYYMNLVRAHIFMITEITFCTTKQTKRKKQKGKNSTNTQTRNTPTFHVIDKTLTPAGELVAMCEQWPRHLASLSKKTSNVRSLLGVTSMQMLLEEYRKDGMTSIKVQLSWWNMILRAFAWRMSVEILIPETPKLVPSWLYKNESRVWIT